MSEYDDHKVDTLLAVLKLSNFIVWTEWNKGKPCKIHADYIIPHQGLELGSRGWKLQFLTPYFDR